MNIRPIVAVLAAGGALLSASSALAECQFSKLGELKVDTSRGAMVIDVVINGKHAKMRLEAGSTSSILSGAGAARLGVTGDANAPVRMITTNGERNMSVTTLQNVVLGGAFLMPRFEILIADGGGEVEDDIVGSIGLDILAASDVEFDLAHDRVAFFQPKDCAKLPLVYWAQAYSQADLRRPSPDRPQWVTTVQMNGKPLLAQFVSSGVTVVDRPSALAVGVGPDTPGVQPTGKINGRDAWVGNFRTFAIGDEQIANVKIAFTAMFEDFKASQTGARLAQKVSDTPSMLVGTDFLRAHRVLFSRSQGRMYFTYNGGPIFARPQMSNP